MIDCRTITCLHCMHLKVVANLYHTVKLSCKYITSLTSIDILPSKNQVFCKSACMHRSAMLNHCKSYEKGFITKEHIVMHRHLNLKFKLVLYSSTLDTKLFSSSIKSF